MYNPNRFRRRLLSLMGALIADAILGVALATFINFNPSKHSSSQDAVLGLHILIAIGIIVGGIVQVVASFRAKFLRLPVSVGFLSSTVAFAAGGISADSGNDVAVFIMAVCFIIALCAYGFSMTGTYRRQAGKETGVATSSSRSLTRSQPQR